MGSIPRFETVECKTIDGTIISGFLFPVPGPAPAIIMSHGFNCVKEMTLPEVAERFQSKGYNVLLYDARNVGASGGMPRNELDPLQMAQDLTDIITYATGLPSVDSRQILLWGMSFGAMVSGCCAAIDRRPKGLVLVCPLFSFVRPDKRKTLFPQLIRDRVSQLRGNQPFTLTPFNAKGENPAGMGGSGGPGGIEAYNLMQSATELGHPDFRNRITLQTYYKLAIARPKELLKMVEDMPVLMVIPELDDISNPEEQKEVFDSLKTPKTMYWAEGQGHLSIMSGKGSEKILEAMESFFTSALDSSVDGF